jgi:hypothetical protein
MANGEGKLTDPIFMGCCTAERAEFGEKEYSLLLAAVFSSSSSVRSHVRRVDFDADGLADEIHR